MSSQSKRRDMDLMKLMMNDFKVDMDNDSMQEFYVHFHGPKDSPYHGGVWKMKVELPDTYPYTSPSIGFVNKIFHPNVDFQTGAFVLMLSIKAGVPYLVNVFEMFLPQLLLYPNPSDPLNVEAAALMLSDWDTYARRVQEYCERYAKPEDIGVAPEEKSSEEEVTEDENDSNDEQVADKDEADP